MSIQKALKKEGIEVIEKIDNLITNTITKNISKRLAQTFPNLKLTEKDLFEKLSKLSMYKAKMAPGMAEASYFYKTTSIYFNEHIDYSDLEEFAIHECIHYLQELKDENNNILKMGLCTYKGLKTIGLSLNEAAVQYTSSHIIGIKPDFEKYYNISLYTPSPSYYPLECSLLNEIIYFTGNESLFRSTLFSNDDFKNKIIELSSEKTYNKLQLLFDEVLHSEESIINLNNKISMLEDGDYKFNKITKKLNKLKNKVTFDYITTQNIIIKEFFDNGFERISNLEELEDFRKKLYKFSDILGSIHDYKFFDNYYIEMMNKLEHKFNILENGGIETALVKKHKNIFITFFKKIFNFSSNRSEKNQAQ